MADLGNLGGMGGKPTGDQRIPRDPMRGYKERRALYHADAPGKPTPGTSSAAEREQAAAEEKLIREGNRKFSDIGARIRSRTDIADEVEDLLKNEGNAAGPKLRARAEKLADEALRSGGSWDRRALAKAIELQGQGATAEDAFAEAGHMIMQPDALAKNAVRQGNSLLAPELGARETGKAGTSSRPLENFLKQTRIHAGKESNAMSYDMQEGLTHFVGTGGESPHWGETKSAKASEAVRNQTEDIIARAKATTGGSTDPEVLAEAVNKIAKNVPDFEPIDHVALSRHFPTRDLGERITSTDIPKPKFSGPNVSSGIEEAVKGAPSDLNPMAKIPAPKVSEPINMADRLGATTADDAAYSKYAHRLGTRFANDTGGVSMEDVGADPLDYYGSHSVNDALDELHAKNPGLKLTGEPGQFDVPTTDVAKFGVEGRAIPAPKTTGPVGPSLDELAAAEMPSTDVAALGTQGSVIPPPKIPAPGAEPAPVGGLARLDPFHPAAGLQDTTPAGLRAALAPEAATSAIPLGPAGSTGAGAAATDLGAQITGSSPSLLQAGAANLAPEAAAPLAAAGRTGLAKFMMGKSPVALAEGEVAPSSFKALLGGGSGLAGGIMGGLGGAVIGGQLHSLGERVLGGETAGHGGGGFFGRFLEGAGSTAPFAGAAMALPFVGPGIASLIAGGGGLVNAIFGSHRTERDDLKDYVKKASGLDHDTQKAALAQYDLAVHQGMAPKDAIHQISGQVDQAVQLKQAQKDQAAQEARFTTTPEQQIWLQQMYLNDMNQTQSKWQAQTDATRAAMKEALGGLGPAQQAAQLLPFEQQSQGMADMFATIHNAAPYRMMKDQMDQQVAEQNAIKAGIQQAHVQGALSAMGYGNQQVATPNIADTLVSQQSGGGDSSNSVFGTIKGLTGLGG